MDSKKNQIAEQLKQNQAALQAVMQSQDGQMLLQMLTSGDRGAGLQNAVQAAMRGDSSSLEKLMNQISQSPEGTALIDRINRSIAK